MNRLCALCGKTHDEVSLMLTTTTINNMTINICGECIDLANKAIKDSKPKLRSVPNAS